MIRPDIQSYINSQLSEGVSRDVIISSLTKAGWPSQDIIDSFPQPQQIVQPLASSVSSAPSASGTTTSITETDYPIQFRWIWKDGVRFLMAVIISIVLLLIGFVNYYLLLLMVYTPFHFIYLILRRKNFHFEFAVDHMDFRQGIINKEHRTTSYGVIQNVFVHQDFFDRIFGLASLAIENAAEGGVSKPATFLGMPITRKNNEKDNNGNIGFKGNSISIPGLNKTDAEKLKLYVLDRMKANPTRDTTSGL